LRKIVHNPWFIGLALVGSLVVTIPLTLVAAAGPMNGLTYEVVESGKVYRLEFYIGHRAQLTVKEIDSQGPAQVTAVTYDWYEFKGTVRIQLNKDIFGDCTTITNNRHRSDGRVFDSKLRIDFGDDLANPGRKHIMELVRKDELSPTFRRSGCNSRFTATLPVSVVR